MSAERLRSLPDPEALIFDLDGTLVDTVEARIQGWLEMFAAEAIPARREQVAPLIGADGKRLAKEVAALAGREMSDEEAERIDALAGAAFDRLNTDPKPLPGARELLAALAGGRLRWAIATSSRREQVLGSVRALAIPTEAHIVDGSRVKQAKPAPDLLLLAAEQLGVPPARAWYVGDATWDIAAAVAAGMIPVGVTTGAVDAAALSGPGAAVVLDSLEHLLADLRRRRLVDLTGVD